MSEPTNPQPAKPQTVEQRVANLVSAKPVTPPSAPLLPADAPKNADIPPGATGPLTVAPNTNQVPTAPLLPKDPKDGPQPLPASVNTIAAGPKGGVEPDQGIGGGAAGGDVVLDKDGKPQEAPNAHGYVKPNLAEEAKAVAAKDGSYQVSYPGLDMMVIPARDRLDAQEKYQKHMGIWKAEHPFTVSERLS